MFPLVARATSRIQLLPNTGQGALDGIIGARLLSKGIDAHAIGVGRINSRWFAGSSNIRQCFAAASSWSSAAASSSAINRGPPGWSRSRLFSLTPRQDLVNATLHGSGKVAAQLGIGRTIHSLSMVFDDLFHRVPIHDQAATW